MHVCANFTHPLSPLLSFFEFFSYFDHHQSTEKEQTIDIQHLLILSIVLNMSKVCHRKIHLFARSTFSAKFLLIRATGVPNSLLNSAYVEYRRHGLVHDFPVERH